MNEDFSFESSQISKWKCPGGNGLQDREEAGIPHVGLFTHMELKATALRGSIEGVRA